jgi:hypothetical protein
MALQNDIAKFKADLEGMAKLVNLRMSSVLRYTAFQFLREVIPAHPVDTGYSRANWRMADDKPDTTTSVPPSYLKQRGGSRYKGAKSKGWYPQREPTGGDIKKDGTDIFVTNSVHYVRWLEEGHSKRAPAHFILMAAQRAGNKINDSVKKARQENPPLP